MKVLVLSDEVWNDDVHGNNVLSNWFSDSNLELANIYCSPGIPRNNCCRNYFQLTDSMMFKSFFGKKSGRSFYGDYSTNLSCNVQGAKEPKYYSILRKISQKTEFFRFARELLWLLGLYDKVELRRFIENFKPDVIFSPRMGTLKFLRLEKFVKSICDKPLVAFTADDEYSTELINYSPIFWLTRYYYRYVFKSHISLYSSYCFFSIEQAKRYQLEFKLNTHVLLKGGEFKLKTLNKQNNYPIKLVYAGKLYVGRWKTLVAIKEALEDINRTEVLIILDIYSLDEISKKKFNLLHDGTNSFMRGGVTANELDVVYKNSDIALHVESFDKRNSLLVKYSFSTKIIDCMASSCAVMAISSPINAGYKYLSDNDIALCAKTIEEIPALMENLVENPGLIKFYRERVLSYGISHHTHKKTQEQLINILESNC